MSLILQPTLPASPDVFIADSVAVLCRDVDPPVSEGFGAFGSPFFEFFAVRVVFDARNHEVG